MSYQESAREREHRERQRQRQKEEREKRERDEREDAYRKESGGGAPGTSVPGPFFRLGIAIGLAGGAKPIASSDNSERIASPEEYLRKGSSDRQARETVKRAETCKQRGTRGRVQGGRRT